MVEKSNNNLNVTDSNVSFASVITAAGLSQERVDEIKDSKILFLPVTGYQLKDGTYFFSNTCDFFTYCQENAPSLPINFCTEKKTFQKIGLNSLALFLGTILVKEIAFPVLVNLISGFLNEKFIDGDGKFKSKIVIEDNPNGNNTVIDFMGTKKDFDEIVPKLLATYNKTGQTQSSNQTGGNINVLS